MKDQELEEIVNELLKFRGKVWETEEIDEFLSNFEISNAEMVYILEFLVNDYIFKWLDFISFKLPSLVNEDDFINLLKKIILKIKGDMVQRPFVNALIKIGEEDVDLGSYLYTQMVSEKDNDLIFYSSFPLGGVGRIDFDKAFSIIKKGFTDRNPHIKAACTRALSVIFENESTLRRDLQIFKILDELSSTKEDTVVQVEALFLYLDFTRFRPDHCYKRVITIARRKDSTIRFNLVNFLAFKDAFKGEQEIEILGICADDENRSVLSRIALALSKKGRVFPEKTLRIIKSWIKRGRYFDVYELDYTISEIGKANQKRSIKEVEKWIKESSKDHRLRFHIPKVLERLSSGNYIQLIDFIKTWVSLRDVYRSVAIQTIKTVLSEIYPLQVERMSVVSACFAILEDMVKENNMDVERIVRGETNKLFQCFRLISELVKDKKELDFQIIFKNSGKFPTIYDFFGGKWFTRMEKERNQFHPLLACLSIPSPDPKEFSAEVKAFNEETDGLKRHLRSLKIKNMISPLAFLEYLEEMLWLIVSKSKKLKDLRAGLRNEDQFWETISEVEVVSSFIRDYTVEIAPELNGKKLDVKVELNEVCLLVEVISPNMFKPLRYLTGKAIGIKNRARDKIFDEFKTHFKGMKIEDSPIVIVIDILRSEINYSSIEEYLKGTSQLTMLFAKESGELVRSIPSRAEDSMHLLEEKTDILSGIIPYKTFLGKDSKFHREGKVMLNPYSKNPLSLDVIKRIEKAFFN